MDSNSGSGQDLPRKTSTKANQTPSNKSLQSESTKIAQLHRKKAAEEEATRKSTLRTAQRQATAIPAANRLLENDTNDGTPKLSKPSKTTKTDPAAKFESTKRTTRADTRGLDVDTPEDSTQMDEEDNAQADSTDEPVEKSTKKERKLSKSKKKGGEVAAVEYSDNDTQAQQHEQKAEAPSRFRVSNAMLREKVKLNSEKNVRCIARRKRWQRDYIEMLFWDEGLQWLRRKFIKSHFKEAVEEYDRARKEGRVILVTISGWCSMEVLGSIRLVDEVGFGPTPLLAVQSDDGDTRSVSPSTSEGDFISHYSDNEYERARQMLIYILRKVFQLSSWQVSEEEGSYQYATNDDEATARSRGFQDAQQLVDALCQLQIDGDKRYEEAKQTLSNVDVVWTLALDDNRMVVEGDNESPLSQSPDAKSKVKLVQIWTTFVERFHIWESSSNSGTVPSVTLDKILPPTRFGLRDLARRMILGSPHIVRPNSWPYLLVLALLTEKDAKAAELEVGLTPSEARFRDVVHNCMTQYQEDTQMDYPEAVHVFWLLRQSLQEERPGNKTVVYLDDLHATRPDKNSGEDTDSEDDESEDFPGNDWGSPSNKKSSSAPPSKRDDELPELDGRDSSAEDAETRSEHEETEDVAESRNVAVASSQAPKHQQVSKKARATTKASTNLKEKSEISLETNDG